MTDWTSRGSFACVSRKSQTPKTSDVGESFASADASPVSRNSLNAFCASSFNSDERITASPSRWPASRIEMVFSLPYATSICGTSLDKRILRLSRLRRLEDRLHAVGLTANAVLFRLPISLNRRLICFPLSSSPGCHSTLAITRRGCDQLPQRSKSPYWLKTAYGGAACDATAAVYLPRGCGTVFKLTPPGEGKTLWTETVSAGLICFDVNGMQPKAVVKRLLQHKIVASTTPYGISYARLAPSLVNTPKEESSEIALRSASDVLGPVSRS